MMSLDDAVELVLYAFTNGSNGDIFVQKAPASTVGDVAVAIRELLGAPDHPINIIGTRHGEKLYETLLTREEMSTAHDLENYFRIPADMRELNYAAYFTEGEPQISELQDYNSHNTTRLDLNQTKAMLTRLPFIASVLSGDQADPPE
jgi:UDP-glucose 4-epimerase